MLFPVILATPVAGTVTKEKVTGKPDDAIAVTLNGASLKLLSGTVCSVIVCAALLITKLPLAMPW
jgi:hypothetical protein